MSFQITFDKNSRLRFGDAKVDDFFVFPSKINEKSFFYEKGRYLSMF